MPPENPQNHNELRATAREFCPTVREEAERAQGKEERDGVPEFVEDKPNGEDECWVYGRKRGTEEIKSEGRTNEKVLI